jgi:hypothetical protein
MPPKADPQFICFMWVFDLRGHLMVRLGIDVKFAKRLQNDDPSAISALFPPRVIWRLRGREWSNWAHNIHWKFKFTNHRLGNEPC